MRLLNCLFICLLSAPLFAQTTEWQGIRYRSVSVETEPQDAKRVASHYVVFEISNADDVQPVFYRTVMLEPGFELSAFAQTHSDIPGLDSVRVTAEDNGRNLGAYTVDVPRNWRAEFAKDPQQPDSELVATQIVAPQRSFVLRAPITVNAVTIAQAGKTTRFDLNKLASTAEQLPLADYVRQLSSFELNATGRKAALGAPNAANRADLVIMGDGYTSAQQSTFFNDVTALEPRFFAPSPLGAYRQFINWRPLFTASAQSGADHPAYQAGCSSASCCADVLAQSDPRAGQIVDTAFDARFCTSQIHRLLTINTSKAQAAAVNAPNWDKLVMLVNDPTYGGSGGSVAVASTNTSAAQVMIHEYGHSFTTLADEYETPFPGFAACSDISGSACEANVTNVTDPNQVKWRARFTPGVPIPTPADNTGLGLFQGARYFSSGMYRPKAACMMRSLGQPFCAVCSDAYLRKLYLGGFGVPSTGISLIEPGSASPSTSSAYIFELNQTVTFFVQVVQVNGALPRIRWYYNDALIPNAQNNGVQLTFSNLGSFQQLRVEVDDESPLLLESDRLMTKKTANWIFQIDPGLFRSGFE